MAVKRVSLTGRKPSRYRKPKRVKFRARRGVKSHGGSKFRAHRGTKARGGSQFRAHAKRAITGARARAAKPWRAHLRAAFRSAGRHGGYARHAKAHPFKPAGHRSPRGWVHPSVKARKYKAARGKRV